MGKRNFASVGLIGACVSARRLRFSTFDSGRCSTGRPPSGSRTALSRHAALRRLLPPATSILKVREGPIGHTNRLDTAGDEAGRALRGQPRRLRLERGWREPVADGEIGVPALRAPVCHLHRPEALRFEPVAVVLVQPLVGLGEARAGEPELVAACATVSSSSRLASEVVYAIELGQTPTDVRGRLRSVCRRCGLDRVPTPASSRPSWPSSPADARGACVHG
jgi:hypothetical protein